MQSTKKYSLSSTIGLKGSGAVKIVMPLIFSNLVSAQTSWKGSKGREASPNGQGNSNSNQRWNEYLGVHFTEAAAGETSVAEQHENANLRRLKRDVNAT